MPLTMSERLEMIHEAYVHNYESLHKQIVDAYMEALKEDLAYGKAREARYIERTNKGVTEIMAATESLDEYFNLTGEWM